MENLFPIVTFIIGLTMICVSVAIPLWLMNKIFGGLAKSIKKTIVALRR